MSKEDNDKLRSRINGMFEGKPESDRFLALMLFAIAGDAKTSKVLDSIRGVQTDFEKKLDFADNRPIRHFLNKTHASLVKELGEDAANKVSDELREIGMEPIDRIPVRDAEVDGDEREQNPERFIASQNGGRVAGSPEANTGFGRDKLYGADGWKAGEIWDLPDAELKSQVGLDDNAISELRVIRDSVLAQGSAGEEETGSGEAPPELTGQAPGLPA